ncbi:hypothetical protein EJB05_09213, partial [Eragrostis curvula]
MASSAAFVVTECALLVLLSVTECKRKDIVNTVSSPAGYPYCRLDSSQECTAMEKEASASDFALLGGLQTMDEELVRK